MYPFNFPFQPLDAVGYPFDCPNIVCLIPFPASNSQAELSKSIREDFNISKWTRTRRLSPYIHTYQSSLQCHFCIPNHLVTRPAIKRRASPLWKNFFPPEKMSWTYCMHNHCFRCYMLCNALLRDINVKFGPPSENCSSPWCPKLVTGLLVTVALWLLSVMPLISFFSQSNFSGLTSNFNRRN